MAKVNTRQRTVVVGVPVVVLALGLFLREWSGTLAILFCITAIGAFLAYLIVESRGYGLSLFTRLLTENRSNYSQMEALQGLLWTLRPASPLPPTRFWAASPDLLREIMLHVLAEKPKFVVEASSGTSTVVIGLCLQRLGAGRVLALEHDPVYVAKTRAALEQHGLSEFVSVVHAPLVKQKVNGADHVWYDLSQVEIGHGIDLLVVDGPPDTTQALARYPALPLLRDRFNAGARILLDDGARPDERTTARRWAEEVPGSSLEYLDLEAGAWSLRMPRA